MLEATEMTLPASAAVVPLAPRAMVAVSALRGQEAALRARLGLPGPAKRNELALWNGPASWLVQEGDAEALALALAGQAAVSAQGDGLALLAVRGAGALDILRQMVSIDIERFGPDDVALTLAAHIGVRLWREGEGFVLACYRSYAGALHHALMAAERNCRARG
jgi:sarcosine oxidase subunit gamma